MNGHILTRLTANTGLESPALSVLPPSVPNFLVHDCTDEFWWSCSRWHSADYRCCCHLGNVNFYGSICPQIYRALCIAHGPLEI